jgi:putative ABC transport system permease protein
MVAGLLAIGIGAVTVAFSFVEAIFLRPLDAPHPEELVRIVQRLPKVGTISSFPEAYFDTVRDHATTLAFTFGEAGEYEHFAMTAPSPAEDIVARGVTPQFFDAFGVQPLYGRLFAADDQTRASEIPAVILSYRFWRRRFGGDRDVVKGATIALNGQSFAVVGVMPETFNGLTTDTSPDAWFPLQAYKASASSRDDTMNLGLAGRLKPRFSRVQAEAECRTLWQSTMKSYYKDVAHASDDDASRLVARGVELDSLERGVSILRDSADGVLKILTTLSLLLLLTVCLNVGGLLSVRAEARKQQFAVQLALGGSLSMLIRQVVAEGLLLSLLGGSGGLLIASAVMPLANRVVPPIRDRGGSLLPLTLLVRIDQRVVLCVVVVSLLAVLIVSASPAMAVCRSSLDSLLRSARSTRSARGRQFLIMLQVAACTSVLLLAGLFVRTLQALRTVDTGFDRSHIATFTANLGGHTGAGASAFLTTLGERVRDIPGVVSASVSSVAVMRGRGVLWTVAPAGDRITRAHFLDANGNTVSADYFDTMGMRIVRGRQFSIGERTRPAQAGSIPTIVNQAFVMKFFPDAEPIGKYFGTPVNGVASAGFQIIGIASDATYRSLREPLSPIFYALGTPSDSFVLNVRASTGPDAIIEPVRKALAAVDPTLPFREVHTMTGEIEDSIANERLPAALASVVGACAALIAGAGIFGTLAYIATQRRREIAIRTALGAGRIRNAKLIARQTLTMVAAGILLGLGVGSVAASGIRSMLFNVSPQDPSSILGAVMFVAVMASAATAAPVIRAINEEPAEALRCEN